MQKAAQSESKTPAWALQAMHCRDTATRARQQPPPALPGCLSFHIPAPGGTEASQEPSAGPPPLSAFPQLPAACQAEVGAGPRHFVPSSHSAKCLLLALSAGLRPEVRVGEELSTSGEQQ